MKHPRKRTANRGYQLSAEAAALVSEQYERRYRPTPNGKVEIEKQSHRQLVDETIDEHETTQSEPPRKIDAIIAEIRAPKPAPTTCWDCGCTSIEVATVGNYPPAYICALCDLWLGDVNPEINVKAELERKLEDLIWALGKISLADEANFQETLELIRLIRAEIFNIESKQP